MTRSITTMHMEM